MNLPVEDYNDLLKESNISKPNCRTNNIDCKKNNIYYLSPNFIRAIIQVNVKMDMNYNEIKKFVEECEITISKEEIINYLNEKKREEHPELISNKKNTELSKEENNALDPARRFVNGLINAHYIFDPYTFEYFKKYTSILKEKCLKLFHLLECLCQNKSGDITDSEWQEIINLDININEEWNIYRDDINRISEAFIYNINDLYEKIEKGNDPETYLKFKLSKEKMGRDGVLDSDLYPSKEIQAKDIILEDYKQYIAFTENQKNKIKQKNRNASLYWINRVNNQLYI